MHLPPTAAGPVRPIAQSLRILVVEDDVALGRLLGEMLEAMGFGVCGLATSETEAIEAAARERPDLMLVDVGLGSGSGLSAMQHIQSLGPMKCLFMTGNVAKLRKAAPDVIALEKPFRNSRLAEAINLLCGPGRTPDAKT